MGTATGASPPALCSITDHEPPSRAQRALPHRAHTGWLGRSEGRRAPRGHRGARETNKDRGIHQRLSTPNGMTAPRTGHHIFLLLIIFHLLARRRRQLPVSHLPPPSGRINHSHAQRGARSAAP